MNEEDLILPVDRIPTTAEFLGALGIRPGGLGAQLFTEVYEQFFRWPTDLRDQYERYYCVEYPTFRQYLEFAHEIYLEPGQLEKRHILKIKSPGGVVDRAYEDNVLETVIECINKLEACNEDQS
ncbi:hypothetical protein [Caulobacter radicis]|uniref:hypothetical protein n=1 Tax=Caulobacter radicis TaxID=2172650 RepID=UPI0010578EE3|nr:hypothetical protein [Caulobacter radicis]